MKAIQLFGQSKLSLFTSRITRDRFEFERKRVSVYEYPVFEMGEYAGELPRKFFNFHCQENESSKMRKSNTEGTGNYPDVPQRNEAKIVIEETEASPTKSLAVLQVTGAKESTVRETEDTNQERAKIGSQECLLSPSDGGSEGLQNFLRDKLDSLSGEGLEMIVEVDSTVVLELLDESVVYRGSTGSNLVPLGKEMPKSSVDYILRAELKKKRLGSVSKRSLCDVDADVAGERSPKSVAFHSDNAGGRLFSA